MAGDLVLAPDWLLAPTEVRAVSHTRAHVDLGAGTELKGRRHHRPANGRRTPCTVNIERVRRGRRGREAAFLPGKMPRAPQVLKRCLRSELTSLAEQDNLAFLGVGKRNADPGRWTKLGEMAGPWEAGNRQKPDLAFTGFSSPACHHNKSLLPNPFL